MEFAAAAALALLVKKLLDLVKYATNRDVNGVVSTLAAWVAGIIAAFVVAETAWGDAVVVGGHSLASMNVVSLVLVGIAAGATGSVVHDTTRAIDNKDSAQVPQLLPQPVRKTVEKKVADK